MVSFFGVDRNFQNNKFRSTRWSPFCRWRRCANAAMIVQHDWSAATQNKGCPGQTVYLNQTGHFIIPQQLAVNVVSGSQRVCPPHLTINTEQKQTACVCVCLCACVCAEVCAAGKMIVDWDRCCCYRPLEADWATGKLCKQINSHEGQRGTGGLWGGDLV